MKNNKKNLWLIALATTLSLSFLGCDGKDSVKKEEEKNDGFEFDTVSNATLWKNYDTAAFDGGTVTKIVTSGAHTYAATSDKGLFVAQADGTWKKVDLAVGKQPGTATVKSLVTGLKIAHLTAIDGDRVFFAAIVPPATGVGLGVAKGLVTENAWLDADVGTTNAPLSDALLSVVTVVGDNNKQNLLAADHSTALKLQLSTAVSELTDVWVDDIAQSGGAFTRAMDDLVLSHDKASVWIGKNDTVFGYDSIVKAQIKSAGTTAGNAAAVPLAGVGGGAGGWLNTALPAKSGVHVSSGFVFGSANMVGFLPTAKFSAGAQTKLFDATVHSLVKDSSGVVKVFTSDKGVLTVKDDGTQDTSATFEGKFTGDNYLDEGKTAAQLEGMKKADLKAVDFATKNIQGMAKSATVTYYLTDKGVFAGKTGQTLKLNKRAKQ